MTSWRAESFDLLPQTVQQRWASYGDWPEGGHFAGLLGIEVEELRRDYARMRLPWRAELNQTSGLMHGGAIMTMADTLGGVGTTANLPEGSGTVTIESKTNFFSAIPIGDTARAECTPLHRGRTTMVWQTRVTRSDGKLAAIVIQTQLVVPPKA